MKKPIITFAGFTVLLLSGNTMSSPDNYQLLLDKHYPEFVSDIPSRSFAGEIVPLGDDDVRSRFEHELHINTYWQKQTVLLIKRAYRYFPVICPILKRNGIPMDFKYLPLIESGFQDMVSPSGAEGPWQFLASTGRRYGLTINGEVDERYDLAKSTEAACRYFKEAYRLLGNWTLVAASYNMGIWGIAAAAQKQDADNYYDLDLNTQTSRYVFRLIAIKEIMEHPVKYGFHHLRRQLYAPIPTVKVRVDSSIPNLRHFAHAHGVSYTTLKEMNPWIKSFKLTDKESKTYYLYIPKDRKYRSDTTREPEYIEDSLLDNTSTTAPEIISESHREQKNAEQENTVIGVAACTHTVKKGEVLGRIAREYKVSVLHLKTWNDLHTDALRPGQKLKIYPEEIGKGKKQEGITQK